MGKYLNRNKKEKIDYRLSSVLIHDGNSVYSGHYYCYVHVGDLWYCFNDQTVFPVNEDKVLSQTPYILFYERLIDKKSIKKNTLKKESQIQASTVRPGRPKKNINLSTNLEIKISKRRNPINQLAESPNRKQNLAINNFISNVTTRRKSQNLNFQK